ncbi:hypothetical protein DYB37_004901 [Aphanomyces astaci]|uniref:Uncharacterized protein n=1 Tax=Aphanomyces astaci TaxID=112090 RepID=A0A418F0J0_APHAT|nr:hypothetical protein DYB37_004901 [Aphanomyces astaci]
MADLAVIQKQVEFYFSDSNFRRDKFLKAETEKNADRFVPFSVLFTFKKLQALTTDPEVLASALEKSTVVELNEDRTALRRLHAALSNDDAAKRTVAFSGLGVLPPSIDEVNASFNIDTVGYTRVVKAAGRFFGVVHVEFKDEATADAVLADKSITIVGRSPKKIRLSAYLALSHDDKRDFEKGIQALLKATGVPADATFQDTVKALEGLWEDDRDKKPLVNFFEDLHELNLLYSQVSAATEALAHFEAHPVEVLGTKLSFELVSDEAAIAGRPRKDSKKRKADAAGERKYVAITAIGKAVRVLDVKDLVVQALGASSVRVPFIEFQTGASLAKINCTDNTQATAVFDALSKLSPVPQLGGKTPQFHFLTVGEEPAVEVDYENGLVVKLTGVPSDVSRDVVKEKLNDILGETGVVAFIKFQLGQTEALLRVDVVAAATKLVELITAGDVTVKEQKIGAAEILTGDEEKAFWHTLHYDPPLPSSTTDQTVSPYKLRFALQTCPDTDGSIDAPAGVDGSLPAALAILQFNALLLQTMMATLQEAHGLPARTFAFDDMDTFGQPRVHAWSSPKLTTSTMAAMDDQEIFRVIRRELPANHDPILHVIVTGCCRFNATSGRAVGHVANGADGSPRVALFGGCGLHTWASSVRDVVSKFTDATKIPSTLLDDSGHRGTFGGSYATGIGALLHEMGHALGLGHAPPGTIMSRGGDDIHRLVCVFDMDGRHISDDRGGAAWHVANAVKLDHSPYLRRLSPALTLFHQHRHNRNGPTIQWRHDFLGPAGLAYMDGPQRPFRVNFRRGGCIQMDLLLDKADIVVGGGANEDDDMRFCLDESEVVMAVTVHAVAWVDGLQLHTNVRVTQVYGRANDLPPARFEAPRGMQVAALAGTLGRRHIGRLGRAHHLLLRHEHIVQLDVAKDADGVVCGVGLHSHFRALPWQGRRTNRLEFVIAPTGFEVESFHVRHDTVDVSFAPLPPRNCLDLESHRQVRQWRRSDLDEANVQVSSTLGIAAIILTQINQGYDLVEHVLPWPNENGHPFPTTWFVSYSWWRHVIGTNATPADYILEVVDVAGTTTKAECAAMYLDEPDMATDSDGNH